MIRYVNNEEDTDELSHNDYIENVKPTMYSKDRTSLDK